MERRQFLEAAGIGGLVCIVGGGRFMKQAYARGQLRQQLIDESVPVLADKAPSELESLPATCRNEMREYFHGVCLNVHGFVDELCSVSFGEKLRKYKTPSEQHQAMSILFTQKVVSSTEVLNRVSTIAAEVGSQLDHNWSECCKKMADSWQASISQYDGKRMDVDKLVEPLILRSIEEARQLARPIGERPALSESVSNVGKAALLLLPVCAVIPAAAPELLPVFVVVALKNTFEYVCGQLMHRAANYQLAITEHFAILGNRVGSEFEVEIKKRVADLHYWQEQAVRSAADQKARELIPSFI